ncbi:MAG TPA: phage minor head protein [Blastocatellia bacterium]|nr:phage minor head protein [Blastocatellia bacterium]
MLGKGLLASYLLALDHTRTMVVEFAEGDDPEKDVEVEAAKVPPMSAGPIKLRFNVPPDEAIDYFKSKKLVIRKAFDKLTEDARASAFTVSGVYKEDVLRAFKNEIVESLEKGTAQGKVIKRFKEILSGTKGHRELGNFHLETVFRSNMSLAYNTGRRRALEDATEDLPYWQYHAVMDDRTRPEHAALHGIIFPANHDFWNTHFPPIGFNCRCSVTAIDQIPDDYNHNSPGGDSDVHLFYDGAGMPAKAEIGTLVYDLAADGKFQGVPPQGGLKEVIEASAKRAQEKRKKWLLYPVGKYEAGI